ncbi:MAG: Crp/Fnr family transcriptional regulator [Pseudomonadales bacterium]|nr:Crp/Fnr family transcriptional regulator [Pseudomonadales bacterium]
MLVTPELLGTFPILKPLSPPILGHLAQECSMQRYARRGIVLNAGENADSIIFLFEGRLQGVDFTIDGREVGLYFVEPGDFCGEIAFFDNGPIPEFVIALTASLVVKAPFDSVRTAMLSNPVNLNVFGSKLASRIRQMTHQRSLLSLPNIPQRVCCQLWMLLSAAEQKAPAPSIINPPTHMEIAIMLNVSRETVTRVFQSLQNQQIVRRLGPGQLLIADPSALQALAEGKKEL